MLRVDRPPSRGGLRLFNQLTGGQCKPESRDCSVTCRRRRDWGPPLLSFRASGLGQGVERTETQGAQIYGVLRDTGAERAQETGLPALPPFAARGCGV